jgi:hypothetical protein
MIAHRPLGRRLALASLALAPLVASSWATAAPPTTPPGPWVFIPPPAASAPSKSSAAAASASAATAKPEDPFDAARRAVCVIERDHKPIALGVLLSEKGVVLTARSPIALGGGASDIEVRFPEGGPGGTSVSSKVKLVHEDEAWDLALLMPLSSRGEASMRPSESDPLSPTASFSTFVLLKNGKIASQSTGILGRRDYLSPEGEMLKDALSIDPKNVAIGTALVDATGGMIGVVGRACAPGTGKGASATKPVPCAPALFGAGLPALRRFLKSAPPIKMPTPWLGIVGANDKLLGVKIIEVTTGSPAALAGLRGWSDAGPGDGILAVDGQLVRTLEELSAAIRKHAVGDEVHLLATRGGMVRDVKVVLRSEDDPNPDDKKSAPPIVAPSTITPLPPLPPFLAPTGGKKRITTGVEDPF